DLLIAVTPMGLKFHVKKIHVQRIYHRVLVNLEKEWGVKRDLGVWVGFYDVDRVIEELQKRI
ncbi:MAG: phosphoesterase, partial [Thermotogae bacterium]|nr:phosphoesterase [Thermotogota bacterium]